MPIIRDYCAGMDVAMGYNPLTGEIYDTYVDYGDLVPAGGQTGQTADLLFKRVTSSAELSSVLGIDFEANLNASWFQGSGSVKAKAVSDFSQKSNEYSTFSVLYVKVRDIEKNLKIVDLSPRIIKFINQNGIDEFYRRAGYEYISGIITGGEFVSTIEIISSDRETKEKMDAELSAQISYSSVASIDAKAEIKSRFANLAKYSNVRIEARCYRTGGAGVLVTTPADALEYAVNFPDSVRKSASILQVLCKPYHDLLSFPTAMQAIDMMTLQKQTRVLQGLWERSQQISKQIADVEYILLNPKKFAQVNEAVLRTGKAQLEHQLEEVNDQAIQFAKNSIKSINVVDFPPIPLALPMRGVELKSAVGQDYTKLQDLLVAGNWKEADAETGRLMLAVAKREQEGWLDVESIDNLPCVDLRTIDQLWVKYSNGRFGFSVQKRIYQSLGGTREYNYEIWEKFLDKVEWQKGKKTLYYKDITFDIKAPKAQIPIAFGLKTDGLGYLGYSRGGLFSRVETCKL
ncbi:GUN4 domain-containing protein [Dolichospermum heterosporum]|uniref:GUN4 domain-containing protein n=1 Tax=Dolichospermum heterosporum TAC447 TaxID=747523 RepID=A0ABY5M318_9CYAN|nr:GUN4 domain-containing protein [Dolichospermum heterosporum]UUO17599.1 GUN4 domain-containing protein [Dolichospermum heterosporum TAC447]